MGPPHMARAGHEACVGPADRGLCGGAQEGRARPKPASLSKSQGFLARGPRRPPGLTLSEEVSSSTPGSALFGAVLEGRAPVQACGRWSVATWWSVLAQA